MTRGKPKRCSSETSGVLHVFVVIFLQVDCHTELQAASANQGSQRRHQTEPHSEPRPCGPGDGAARVQLYCVVTGSGGVSLGEVSRGAARCSGELS